VLRDAVDPRFEFVSYAESLAQGQPSFDPLAGALAAGPNLIDRTLSELTLEAMTRHPLDMVWLSVSFAGSVYAAFGIAQAIKARSTATVTVLGGGYVDTELRELRVFDYFDFFKLDAGERPLQAQLEHLVGQRPRERLVCTFVRDATASGTAKVRLIDCGELDIPFADVGTPTWDGLPLDRYLSVLDLFNPTHRLWSDGR
jgi:hypothetical protein